MAGGLKAEWVKVMKADKRGMATLVKAAKKRNYGQYKGPRPRLRANDMTKLDRRFNKAGLTDCARGPHRLGAELLDSAVDGPRAFH